MVKSAPTLHMKRNAMKTEDNTCRHGHVVECANIADAMNTFEADNMCMAVQDIQLVAWYAQWRPTMPSGPWSGFSDIADAMDTYKLPTCVTMVVMCWQRWRNKKWTCFSNTVWVQAIRHWQTDATTYARLTKWTFKMGGMNMQVHNATSWCKNNAMIHMWRREPP